MEDRSDHLLDVAARLFRDRGVAGASIRAIAAAAGMHLGSVTYRYRTKDALLVGLMKRALGRATAAVKAALAAATDPIERLELAIRAHAECVVGGDGALGLLFLDWRRFSEHARGALEQDRHQYEALWDGIVYAADGSSAPGLVRELILGGVNAVAMGEPRAPDEIAGAVVELLGQSSSESRL